MSKPLHVTAHAKTVILERQLEFDWIERTVRNPDWSESDPSGLPTERRFGRIPEREDRILRVIRLESETEIRIITAFLDRNARMPR
ncbi:DUF4258 domain-containing protein [Rhizobium sp. AAP116]|jgi:hypothetical protein|uniref:DUF4258 domain-containing protein n=1 Tax=Rhizobium sp. AAP116 TaxID=1523429 RepID=UPI0009EC8111|nr:DUF4258 domain-containing protein [Rhizobium sp. AAP116]